MKTKLIRLFVALALLALPALVQAQFTFTTNNGAITISGYSGGGGTVVIPAATNGYSVTAIGYEAFNGQASITSVTIPNSVTNIGSGAFYSCSGLTNVTIGTSVLSIGGYAFYSCSGLTSVTIPNSVTNIGDYAFDSCSGLTNIAVDAANPSYASAGGVLFNNSLTLLVECPGGLAGSYTISNSVTSIGDGAFNSCSGLTNVIIPNSVTSIGQGAFSACHRMTSVTVPNSVTSIGDSAFATCTSLASVMIPNSVTSIGVNAFARCSSLTSVTIGNGVTSIGYSVFFNCTHLISVTIPNSVTSIGANAFAGCSSLTSVTIPNSVTSIGDYAFDSCSRLASVTIPNSIISIGNYAFENCSGLTSVTIGNSVTSIGDYAFVDCPNLTSVTIPNSVTNIGYNAFEYCSGLTNVTIPNSVTSIGSSAFYNCTSLHQAYFTGNAPSPNNDSTVFSGDPATVYYLPGTTGWGAMFDGLPTAPWFLPNPLILNQSASFGVQPGGFGFTISWATNASVVVEAATNLANPVWIPVSTNTLTGGTNYFSDPQWTNYPGRYYRVQLSPAFTVGGTLTGLPAGDTVTLQDNGSDDLTLSNNGTFTFPTALPDGHAYSVTVSGTSGGTSIYPPVTANFSGTISGANVTNVAIQCTRFYTGNLDVDMYNAAVRDGTANGGVPGVMHTENGGPFRVTAENGSYSYSYNIARIYYPSCVFTRVVGTTSCSSTTFPSGANVIQFGAVLECGFGPYHY